MKVAFTTTFLLLLTNIVQAGKTKAGDPCKKKWVTEGTDIQCEKGQVCHDKDTKECTLMWIEPSTNDCDPDDKDCCYACEGCCKDCPNYDETKDCPVEYTMVECDPPDCCAIIGCGGRRLLRGGEESV